MLKSRGYVFVTPVWGPTYTTLFLLAALPTQLAPGNLPAMRHRAASVYQIHTTPADEARIRESSLFAHLSALIEVQFITIDPTAAIKHGVMSDCYRVAIESAREVGAGVIFLTPDMIMSDGTLACMERHGEAGKTAIMIVGLRLVEETTMAFLQGLADSTGAVAMSPRQLMAHAQRNLHQITQDHIWNTAEDRKLIPNNLFWSVGEQGLLGRCFHLMPILVRPEVRDVWFASTVDDDFIAAACPNPQRHHVVTNSDELMICELTEGGRSLGGYPREGLDTLRKFAELLADDIHCQHVRIPVRLHSGITDEEAWRSVEAESDAIVNTVLSSMDRSWLALLCDDPLSVARRLVRLQNSYRIKLRTGQPLPVSHGTARLVMGIGWAVKQLVPVYGRFVRILRKLKGVA